MCRAIFMRATSRKGSVRVASHWSDYPIYLRLNSSDVNVFRQVFIEREYQLIEKCAGSHNIIIDAGANIGLTSLFISSLYPEAKIYAVEPEVNNFALLKANTTANRKIVCIQGALWSRDEQVSILSEDDADWAFQVGKNSSPVERGIQGFRMSSLMDYIKVSRVSLLKMDIEGAEYEVFKDAGSWIDKVENIVLELHENIQPGCTELFRKATSDFVELGSSRELTLVSRRERST
jgi:FkbM family methyltransferase